MKSQSTQQHADPAVSSPMGENNAMEANHQANNKRGASDLPPNPPKRLPILHSWLAQNLQMISLVGPPAQRPRHHSEVHCPGPKGLGVKTRKQLAAETLHEQQYTTVTLILVTSCPSRKNPLTLLWFLPFIQVLTWKWRCYDGEDG